MILFGIINYNKPNSCSILMYNEVMQSLQIKLALSYYICIGTFHGRKVRNAD